MSPTLKLSGVLMVRNEADIIEASVRHNLANLDRLVVIDHGSFDGTREILDQLAAESAALRIAADPSLAFRQGDRITQFSREAIEQDDADFVFALDADEFLKIPSRPTLETALRALPQGMHAMLHWQTYVPDDAHADAAPFSPLQARRRLRVDRHNLQKVVVARHFATQSREVVADGNHCVLNLDQPTVQPRHARIAAHIAAVAHVPVRNRRQLEKKVILGYLACLAAGSDQPNVALHWRDLYEAIREGKGLAGGALRDVACNYGLPRADWQPAETIELVDDPIAFTADLRYRSDAGLDTLQLLMRFCERLLDADAAANATNPAAPTAHRRAT